jgi:hypothetical protein
MEQPESPTKRRRANTSKAEVRNRIVAALNKFFKRRPTKEYLQERNIFKDRVTATQNNIERARAASRIATFLSTKPTKNKYPQFGLTPSQLATLHPDQPQGIPRVVWMCINYLDNELDTEGLFRVPGSFREIALLRSAAETGCVDILAGCPYAHTVTGLVSSFFRDLPDPLIINDLYESFVGVALIPEHEKDLMLRSLIKQLPPANIRLLRAFLALLYRVHNNSGQNKMTASNLGLVFGPTLLRPPNNTTIFTDGTLAASCSVLAHMIKNHSSIFPPAITPPPRPPRGPSSDSHPRADPGTRIPVTRRRSTTLP